MKNKTIRCPYCGAKAILRDASFVYGKHSKGELLYVCNNYPKCDAYVGVHQGTIIAKGTLANKALRQKRIYAHQIFDQIWKQGIFSKKDAYLWIADKFSLTSKQAHIVNFSDYMCDQLILEASKVLLNNRMPLQAIG